MQMSPITVAILVVAMFSVVCTPHPKRRKDIQSYRNTANKMVGSWSNEIMVLKFLRTQ